MSERHSCRAANLSRTVYRYVKKPRDDREVEEALSELAILYPDLGLDKYFPMLRKAGRQWNKKRVRRVYIAMGLNKRRKHKRRLPSRNPEPLAVPEGPNVSWSCDFMADVLSGGRRFRTFNVLEDFNREGLAIEVDLSLTAERVVRVLDRIALLRGLPSRIRMDNGPEFTSTALEEWAALNEVELDFIEPGKPMQNGYIERFNRSYRQGVLDMYIFDTLDEVRLKTEDWLRIYNEERPHDSLGDLTPVEYMAKKRPENWNLQRY